MKEPIVAQRVQDLMGGEKNLFSKKGFVTYEPNQRYITWKDFQPSSYVEFSWLRASGRSIESLIKETQNQKWEETYNLYKAHVLSCKKVNMDLNEVSFYDLLPEFLLSDYLDVLNQITSYVWENYNICPKLYETYKGAHLLSLMIEDYNLNFDTTWVGKNLHSSKVRRFKRLTDYETIKYDIFGTKTGRFTTKSGSFPILTLDKTLRRGIFPNNDLFVVYDFNAAEMRTFLSLSGLEQPDQDLHEWNKRHIFENRVSRDESKIRFFSWLYDNSKVDKKLDMIFDREKIIEKYWNGTEVVTDFGRHIPSTGFKALNHLIQSTTNDLIVESLVNALGKIPQLKGRLAFTIHDSIVLDCKKEDACLLEEFKTALEETRYGKFLCSFHLGKNLLNLKDVS